MFNLFMHRFPAVDLSSEKLPFPWQLCQLTDIHMPQGPILFNTSMWSRSKIKHCVCARLFAANTEYESSGKCHLWGQIIRVGTLSAAVSSVFFNGIILFWNNVQGANTPKNKRPPQAVRLSANASPQLHVMPSMEIFKISRAHVPGGSISKLNLQLGMLISSETILRLLIHHSQAHESTLTNDQMRPYFNLLLIPFQLLSSPAHITSFSIIYNLNAIITG